MGQIYDHAGALVRGLYHRRLHAPPVLDMASEFPGGVGFVAAWRAIRDEALSLRTRLSEIPRFHDLMPEQADISANDGRDWRVFLLKAYGHDFPGRLAQCPVLAGLLAASPEVLSATLSYMAPGKHIPPHQGPFGGVMRFYLVLDMPKLPDGSPAAVLRVAGTDHTLDDGDALLWDDTFEHEVWNKGTEVRTVLLLDVWRPRMPADMELLSRVIAAGVRLGIRLRGVA
jgi:aspartate beta-hydroxylase